MRRAAPFVLALALFAAALGRDGFDRWVDTTVLPPDLVKRGRGLVDLARATRGTIPPADDTVPDPMGGPESAHHDAVRLIFAAVHGIVDELAPRVGTRV